MTKTIMKEKKVSFSLKMKPVTHLNVVPPDASETLSFDAVFDRFAPYVAAIGLRIMGNASDIDDIVQDVFLDFSRKMEKINDIEHARRWLVYVTVRKCRKLLRKRKILSFLYPAPPVEPVMPMASADDRAAVIQLFCILEKMPVNHRMAWSLRYLEGASLSEISLICGCSLATAKRWIKAAQKRIVGGEND
jgi:RNA polymerase sigma-70 factor, ECF subfamily